MKNYENDNYNTTKIIKFNDISIIKLNQNFSFSFKKNNYKLKFFKSTIHLSRIFFNNIKIIKTQKLLKNISFPLLYSNFFKPSKRTFHDISIMKKKILLITEYKKQKSFKIYKIQQTLCSNIAWEFFLLEYNDFTNFSQDAIHAYSFFSSRRLVRVARSGYYILTDLPLETYVFRKNPCNTENITLHRENRERLMRESLLIGSRDFYAHGEYRLRLLVVGIGFPWITTDKFKTRGLFNNVTGTTTKKHVSQTYNIRAHGTSLMVTVYDKDIFRVSRTTDNNVLLKNFNISKFPDIVLLSEKLAFFREGYNDTVAFASLVKILSYRLWFKTILLLDANILRDKSYITEISQGDIRISHNIRTDFLWTLDLLSSILFDRFRKSFTLNSPIIKASLQKNTHIIGKTAILVDHIKNIEHMVTISFMQLFFTINTKSFISEFKILKTTEQKNGINNYDYEYYGNILKSTNISVNFQPIKTMYFFGTLVNIADNKKKFYLMNNSLSRFSAQMYFSYDASSFFKFNKKKLENEFYFSDRIALGFSRSFLRHLHGLFYTGMGYFTLERNSILFFNKVSELVVRILLQNIYSDCSIQLRDYRDHAAEFTISCYYNHRWFPILQLQQEVTPLLDHTQSLSDTSLHLSNPTLRFALFPDQDTFIQRLELEEYEEIYNSYYHKEDELHTPLIHSQNQIVSGSSDYLYSNQTTKEETRNIPLFLDVYDSEKNQIRNNSNKLLDLDIIMDITKKKKYMNKSHGEMYYLDILDDESDYEYGFDELFIGNTLSRPNEILDTRKNKFLQFSIVKENTIKVHGISSINAYIYRDMGVLLFITLYARILEHSEYHSTVTENLKRLQSIFKTSLYKKYTVTELSSQTQIYSSSEYIRTAKDEDSHYVTSIEDDITMSRIEEMEFIFDDYCWEGLLLNQSEDTDDYSDEDETFSESESFFEEISEEFIDAGKALNNLEPDDILGVHAFLYSEDFYETRHDHLERPDISLNKKNDDIISSLIRDHDFTFPWAIMYEAEIEKFESDPLENQRLFSHKHLDLLELFSYQKWKQEYFLTKNLEGDDQSDLDRVFDYDLYDVFSSHPIRINGIMREDTLNRESFPDEDPFFDEWYEEDPDNSYYYDKMRFQGLNLSDLVILKSQTHPSLNVPIYANLYIDQVAGLSTNLTLIINSCKKLSENVVSLISFEAMRSLDAEGTYFSIAHLATLKAPDNDDDFCCGVHSGISIYRDRFGQSSSYCLLYEEEYSAYDCIAWEMTLTNMLHEIPFMITHTFYCNVIIDIDLPSLFYHTGMEIEFSIDKSLDPMIDYDYDLNFIEIDFTDDIDALVVLYFYPFYYYYIFFMEEADLLLPGCLMFLDIILYFISEPLLLKFEIYDYYLIDDEYFESPELYNEIATEEEFRLLMKKNKSSFIKKVLHKTWTFISRK
ncbi:hypothetical protein M951_chr2162 (nucleomorph) [Lotharella oceanica]|uniref:Uncharacterized protein n=1 Tax=Lotharella oceanica TaxID=641309 RepID=A0A060DBI7_9EUKA|nr:hypothetical protein M951_chr2162 [Lotharella oceanica]|mmetsp:Transcript_4848/g.9632  ORF Transcript_4848/g.9632 Transcript_4848/m.9632 type:complete len:1421 (-) Transcript_4848:733-4995(-)